MRTVRSFPILLLILSMILSGCDDVQFGRPKEVTTTKGKDSRWKKGSPAAKQEKAKAGTQVADDKPRRAKAVPREGATVRHSTNWAPSGSSPSSGAARSEGQAVERIGQSIRESLDVGPTLVVWVLDRSESASRLVASTVAPIKSLYASEDLAAAGKEGKLLTAILAFDDKADFLLDPPAGDPDKVNEALDALKAAAASREATFAALKLTLEKYLPVRTKERREVLIAVVTDEPGDDLPVLDDVVALAQRNAIPVFVVGPSAPLGKPVLSEAGNQAATGDLRTPSADAYFVDWVSFDSGYGGADKYDSGLGPWGLERLCRESSGAYLTVGSSGSSLGGGYVDPAVMSKYAPDYLSVAAMEKSLKENKCRQALVAAATLPAIKASLLNPQTIFPKRNEAEMQRMIIKAQLAPAKLEKELTELYDMLAGEKNAIERDREKLTGRRWQAAYDTAFGRAAAAKARVDGYNVMLAALKRGKTFENASSDSWVLEPADTVETGSAIQQLVDKARTYLERVQKEHPGTPWARVAEQELRMPLSWKWREQ